MDHCTDEELCVQGHIASKRQRPDLKLGVSDDRGEHPSIRCTQDAFAEPSLHPPPPRSHSAQLGTASCHGSPVGLVLSLCLTAAKIKDPGSCP